MSFPATIRQPSFQPPSTAELQNPYTFIVAVGSNHSQRLLIHKERVTDGHEKVMLLATRTIAEKLFLKLLNI
ncbi:hypothetical protein A3195_02935 [Candidatus Thiodiazotropha endoloripes]|nr:hypothetical protein A3193_14020 [Candidatus Thiodiazotropha endoloripes]ODB90448.1 hypothetical protein A3195_02935 [Candidatus Thiodiazotropha endoloripes]ODB93829.1 hypothetical protein A3194_03900 [Candidatus Thiodiazotropha endoloripes]